MVNQSQNHVKIAVVLYMTLSKNIYVEVLVKHVKEAVTLHKLVSNVMITVRDVKVAVTKVNVIQQKALLVVLQMLIIQIHVALMI